MSSLVRELVAIAGCTGSGKTLTARAILATTAPRRGLLLDPLAFSPNSLARFWADRVFTSIVDLHQALTEVGPGANVRFAFCPKVGKEPEAAAYLGSLAEWMGKHGPLWLILEEAAVAAKYPAPPKVVEIAQRGRHMGPISLMVLSQRPVRIDPDVREELYASECWLLRLAGGRNLGFVTEGWDRELADRVGRLELLRALRVRPNVPIEEYAVSIRNGVPEVTRCASAPLKSPARSATPRAAPDASKKAAAAKAPTASEPARSSSATKGKSRSGPASEPGAAGNSGDAESSSTPSGT